MPALLARIHAKARLKHHELALRQARRQLTGATGEDFDRLRLRVFELEFCLDPLTCGCLDAKPYRKVREA